jgi:hypothetical protein
MKEVLQRVKEKLEQSFDNPGAYDLEQCLRELEQLKATPREKRASTACQCGR